LITPISVNVYNILYAGRHSIALDLTLKPSMWHDWKHNYIL